VLLVGSAGTGKSTSALACAAAGLCFLAEDRIGIERTDGGFVAHSLYCSAWIEREHLARHPQLGCRTPHVDAGSEKVAMFLAESPVAAVVRRATIEAVVLSGWGDGEPAVRPGRAAEAALALGPTSVVDLWPAAAAWTLELVGDLVFSVPVFRLGAGRDPASAPPLVERVLDLAARVRP
jgi:hypothetical protein